MNRELPDVQVGFRKGRGSRDPIANIRWIIEKAREFQKNIYSCFIDYTKAFDCVDRDKLWRILQGVGIPDHFICLLRNLHACQEATVRTGHGKMNSFQIVKGVHQACCYPAFLFCYLACLTYMQSTWCEMPGKMKHKLESRFLGEKSISSGTQMTAPLWRKDKRS